MVVSGLIICAGGREIKHSRQGSNGCIGGGVIEDGVALKFLSIKQLSLCLPIIS